MPAKKQLLPRPCPQCKKVNGGVRFILFNPEYRGWKGDYPVYPLLCISHYSPELRKSKERRLKNTAKICHYFPVKSLYVNIGSESIRAEDIFNHSNNHSKQSISLEFNQDWFDDVKKYGWLSIIEKKGHWLKGMKFCDRCDEPFRSDELKRYHYDNEYYKKKYGKSYRSIVSDFCKDCYAKEREAAARVIQESKILLS